jgi:eukaryotic-like serine/threonine-protein kinase
VTAAPDRLAAALADRYRVERELGQGGMATVYLAEDLKHHRRVALKVLRPELAATLGPDRFVREIEVAARLQHPHILPLHDSGEAGGFLYYVMPFVDGESLRRRLAGGSELPIHDAVRILSEVADALAYAHGHGVVHRDIKPDNVLLSGRHALVTDFGVAKAVSEATGRQQLTTAGIALGTPAYMAPEQAAADPAIDHRVDIYALGAMAYELLTGRPPFVGSSSQEVLAAHITQAPEPLSARRPGVPSALSDLIMRCLAKRPAERWQNADELASQLEQQLTPTGGTTPSHTRPTPTVHPGRGPVIRVAVIAGLGLLAAGAGLLLPHRTSGDVPQLGKRSALTLDPGLELNPALSPDGKFVAYSRMAPAESRLAIQQLAGGEPVTVARWPGLYSAIPSWSPDGSRLAYRSPRGIEVIPALGGASRLLATQSRDPKHGWAAWSPDGNTIAYTSADTIYLRDLQADSPKAFLQAESPHSPVWSPDGKWIAYVSGNPLYPETANLAPSSIWVVRASAGRPIRITDDRPLHTSPVWLPDSRGLLYVSDQDGGRDIYFVRLSRSGTPDGAPVRLTTGLYPHTISLSADGRKLVYALYGETSNVGSIPLQRGRSVSLRDAKPITTGTQVIEGFSVSPDGAWLAFDSNRNGNQDVWRMPLDGSSPPEILSAGPEDEFQPTYSPDGKWIGFHATRSGAVRDLYLIPAGGGRRTRINVETPNSLVPRFSPDGRFVLYTVWSADGGFSLRAARRPAEDSTWSRATPVFTVPSNLSGGGGWSPNGKWICYIRGMQLFRADADGQHSEPVATFSADFTPFYAHFSGDSRLLYYSGINVDGTYLIYAVPSTGGRITELAHSEGPSYQNFRFPFQVRDTTLYISLADRQSDVWMADILPK